VAPVKEARPPAGLGVPPRRVSFRVADDSVVPPAIARTCPHEGRTVLARFAARGPQSCWPQKPRNAPPPPLFFPLTRGGFFKRVFFCVRGAGCFVSGKIQPRLGSPNGPAPLDEGPPLSPPRTVPPPNKQIQALPPRPARAGPIGPAEIPARPATRPGPQTGLQNGAGGPLPGFPPGNFGSRPAQTNLKWPPRKSAFSRPVKQTPTEKLGSPERPADQWFCWRSVFLGKRLAPPRWGENCFGVPGARKNFFCPRSPLPAGIFFSAYCGGDFAQVRRTESWFFLWRNFRPKANRRKPMPCVPGPPGTRRTRPPVGGVPDPEEKCGKSVGGGNTLKKMAKTGPSKGKFSRLFQTVGGGGAQAACPALSPKTGRAFSFPAGCGAQQPWARG